jgi:hypothetical protein
MKILIASNFAVGFFLCLVFIIDEKFEYLDLLGILLLPSFLLMFFVNLGFAVKSWKQRRYFSLVPISTYVMAFILFVCVTRAGANLMLKGTPCRPESFFDETKKSELTQIAIQILKDEPAHKPLPAVVGWVGKKYSLSLGDVDTNHQIVTFGYYHQRMWFEYIFSENGSTNVYHADGDPILLSLGNGWYFRNW